MKTISRETPQPDRCDQAGAFPETELCPGAGAGSNLKRTMQTANGRVPLPWFGVRHLENVTKVALWGKIGMYGLPVTELIRSIGNAGNVEIGINVDGGGILQTFELLDAIEGRFSRAFVVRALSAGALVALSAKRVEMQQPATIMLHRSQTLAYGDETVLLKHLGELRRQDDRIQKIISARTGQDASQYMDGREHWFTAEQAKAAGLIDSIV